MKKTGRDIFDEAPDKIASEEDKEGWRRRMMMQCSKAELAMMMDISKDRMRYLETVAEKAQARAIEDKQSYMKQLSQQVEENSEMSRKLDNIKHARASEFVTMLSEMEDMCHFCVDEKTALIMASAFVKLISKQFGFLSFGVKRLILDRQVNRDLFVSLCKKACKSPRMSEPCYALYDYAGWLSYEREREEEMSRVLTSCGCGHPGAHPPCSWCTREVDPEDQEWLDNEIIVEEVYGTTATTGTLPVTIRYKAKMKEGT